MSGGSDIISRGARLEHSCPVIISERQCNATTTSDAGIDNVVTARSQTGVDWLFKPALATAMPWLTRQNGPTNRGVTRNLGTPVLISKQSPPSYS